MEEPKKYKNFYIFFKSGKHKVIKAEEISWTKNADGELISVRFIGLVPGILGMRNIYINPKAVEAIDMEELGNV